MQNLLVCAASKSQLLKAFFPTSPLSKEHTRKYTHVHVNLETAELFRLIHEA